MRGFSRGNLLVTLAIVGSMPAYGQNQPKRVLPRFQGDIDSSAVRQRISISRRTLIAVVDLDTRDSLRSVAALAQRLGYDYQQAVDPLVVDERYNAMYYMPPGLSRAYIVILPGRRPDFIPAPVSLAVLEERIRRFTKAHQLRGYGQ